MLTILLFGLSQDKSVDDCLRLLLDRVPSDRIHLCSAPHRRAAPVAHLAARLRAIGARGASGARTRPDAGSVADATNDALRAAWGQNDVVVVVGSLFIMAEARACLGIVEARDEVVKQR